MTFLTVSCVFLAVCVPQSAMFQHAMWGYDLFAPFSIPHVLDGLFTFAALEFLSAGLFITTRKCPVRNSVSALHLQSVTEIVSRRHKRTKLVLPTVS